MLAKKNKRELNESRFTDQERLDWLRLIRSENVGTKAFYTLIGIYGDATTALEHAEELSLRGGRKHPIKMCSVTNAKEEMDKLYNFGAQLVARPEKTYPKRLSAIDDPPPVLTIQGNLELLQYDSIAIVGARNATANGCRYAYRLAETLGKKHLIIVSGLARGIDTAAHKGALDTGTVAVIAGGIDNIYPPENNNLQHSITEKGVVIAELPFGSVPRGRHFPQRNRIISGLSLGTVVVEAAVRSGSLITARFALEQGREVFAVPGSPLDPRSEGPNKLIKQGATLIESADDIEEALHPMLAGPNLTLFDKEKEEFLTPSFKPPDNKELEEVRNIIKAKLGSTAIEINALIQACDLPANIVQIVLLELELAGNLSRYPGNKVSLLL